MAESFADIDDEVRSDYGEQYLKDLRANFVSSVKISSPKMYKVLDALEDAISLEEPDVAYQPSRNIIFTAFYKFVQYIPTVVFDFLCCQCYVRITGFPTPKEASNCR